MPAANDVRFACEDAEHITLCRRCNTSLRGALHHFGEAETSLFTNDKIFAIIMKEPPKDDYEAYAQKVIKTDLWIRI